MKALNLVEIVYKIRRILNHFQKVFETAVQDIPIRKKKISVENFIYKF